MNSSAGPRKITARDRPSIRLRSPRSAIGERAARTPTSAPGTATAIAVHTVEPVPRSGRPQAPMTQPRAAPDNAPGTGSRPPTRAATAAVAARLTVATISATGAISGRHSAVTSAPSSTPVPPRPAAPMTSRSVGFITMASAAPMTPTATAVSSGSQTQAPNDENQPPVDVDPMVTWLPAKSTPTPKPQAPQASAR